MCHRGSARGALSDGRAGVGRWAADMDGRSDVNGMAGVAVAVGCLCYSSVAACADPNGLGDSDSDIIQVSPSDDDEVALGHGNGLDEGAEQRGKRDDAEGLHGDFFFLLPPGIVETKKAVSAC